MQPETLTRCLRCRWPAAVRPDERAFLPPVPLYGMRAAQRAQGLCFECALHWWLFTVDGLRWAAGDNGPHVLALPQVQAMIGRALERMGTHIDPQAINWRVLIAQWDLAWPEGYELPSDERTAP
jgi:hypothetical protein